MKKRWLFFCLFLLIFLVFFAGAVNEIWDRHTVSKNDFIQLTDNKKVDRLDQLRQELVIALAEIIPDEQSYNRACQTAYLQEDIVYDETIYSLYLKEDSGKDLLIWCIEADRLKNAKIIKILAKDAAYVLFYHLSKRSLPAISTPAKKVMM